MSLGKGGRSVLSFRQGGGSNPELTPTVHVPHFGPQSTYIGTTLRAKYILFGHMDP